MDSWRPILAFVICAAILLGWSFLFPVRQQVPPPQPPRAREAAPDVQVQAPGRAGAPQGAEASGAAERPRRPEESAPLTAGGKGFKGGTPLRATASNRGAGVVETRLPEFKARLGEGETVFIPPHTEPPLTLGLGIEDLRVAGEGGAWTAVPARELVPFPWETWSLESMPGESGVALRNEGNGLAITKEIRAVEGKYHLEVALTFENRSAERRQFHYRLWGPVRISSEALRGLGTDLQLIHGERGPGGHVHVRVEELPKQSDWVSAGAGKIAFAGSQNNYFAAVLGTTEEGHADSAFAEIVPDQAAAEDAALKELRRPWANLEPAEKKAIGEKVFRNLRVGLRSRAVTLEPQARQVHRYLIFLGPRDDKVLASYPGYNLTGINDYGFGTFLVKIFIQLLKGLHWLLIGSWGLAIIGLTFLVRLCLHPLNRRQQISMMRYQKKITAIKPQMDALKERYGSNRMKMNQELQKLFKEEGVHPGQMMGGCLMILLQFPVWLALYKSLQYSLDLRNAPFLWIKDLTQEDRLLHLPFQLPFLGEYLNILPIIYVVLTILQQKMQPKPTDPQMQQQMRMMTYMLVFFGFLFYNFPGGFLLYFIASAAIGIVESKVIKRRLAREGLVPSPATAGTGPPGAPRRPSPLGSAALYPARSPREAKRKKG